MITSKSEDIVVNAENNPMKNSKREKLLGVKIDYKLTFNSHIDEICKKSGSKTNAFSRSLPYMNIEKRRNLLKTLFISQFNYCPLIWMCHSCAKNNKITFLHERCPFYNGKTSIFKQLPGKDISVSIHIRNLWFLASKIFSDLFPLKEQNNYNLREKSILGPKIWKILPQEIQECESLLKFKVKIKSWNPINCPCKLREPYVAP